MPKLKKSVQKQNLSSYRVWINDTDPSSRYFRLSQLPDLLTAGRNSILVNGSPELEQNTSVLIEIIDADGDTIYIEPIAKYLEGTARVISVEIYDDTPPGPATITILGQLRQDENGNKPPQEFAQAYNVKWTKQIIVSAVTPNVTPIRLYKKPTLTINELLIPFQKATIPVSRSVSGGTILGNTVLMAGTQYKTSITSNTLKFNRDMLDSPFTASINGISLTSSIDTILNDSTAYLYPPFTGSTAPFQFSTTTYNVSYLESPAFSITLLSRSFADIKISNLRTFSGDVQRAKLYVKSIDQVGDYVQFADLQLESTNLTATQSLTSGETDIQIGYVKNPSYVSSYWECGTFSNKVYTRALASASYNSSSLLDSIYLTVPSTLTSYSDTPLSWMGLKAPLEYTKDLEYTLEFNAVCQKGNTLFDGIMEVYIVGDAFPSSSITPYGYKLATLTSGHGAIQKLFLNNSLNFISPITGNAQLRFVVFGGEWYVSDVKILSSNAFGFNPDEVRIITPIVNKRFERLQFKMELYDINNNRVPITIETSPLYFDGGNTIQKGSDNRIEGTVTVASSGSGVSLSTEGFHDKNNIFKTGGKSIAIGAFPARVKSRDTAFFAGTSSAGPEISVGDKLHGYVDPVTNDFILEIEGTLLVGSGSNKVDIRKLIPGQSSFGNFTYVKSAYGDFDEIRATRAFLAGPSSSEYGRFGKYSRIIGAPSTFVVPTVGTISSSYNPFETASSTIWLSGTINLAGSQSIVNETLYGSFGVEIVASSISNGAYILQYDLQVATKWQGYPADSGSDTGSYSSVLNGQNQYITSPGTIDTIPVLKYPIYIPTNRGTHNTLYWKLKLITSTTPSF